MTTACKRGKPVGSRKSGGRRAGTPNRATREFRETVNKLLSKNAENIGVWLDSVADGDPAAGRPPDPARALDLLIKLAEFAAPKLARVECLDAQGLRAPPAAIRVEFVEAPTRERIGFGRSE